MTQKEKIEYLAKAVMTLSELGDGKTAYALNEIRLEMKSQLGLPEGLDEAAEEQGKTKFYTRADDFKAGAEWMAGQGVTCEFFDHFVETLRTLDKHGFKKGDKVIVQIRKKEDEK